MTDPDMARMQEAIEERRSAVLREREVKPPVTGPEYETTAQSWERLGYLDMCVCTDCGTFVMDKRAHDRFHSILSEHALAIAILLTSHIGERVHSRYDVHERINRRREHRASCQEPSETSPDV